MCGVPATKSTPGCASVRPALLAFLPRLGPASAGPFIFARLSAARARARARALTFAAKHEITRRTAFPPRLRLVTGANVTRPWLAPICGAFRSPAKCRCAREALQRPGRVVCNVGRKVNVTARAHHAREHRDGLVADDPALPMSPLGPWVRIEDIGARDRAIRQPIQQFGCVAKMQANVADVMGLDGGQHLGHPVDERLATDEPDVRVRECLRREMFTTAETDFEPD